jgi:DNA-binding XRE family transcriptional regulator
MNTTAYQHLAEQDRRQELAQSLPCLSDRKRLRLQAQLSFRRAGEIAGVAHTTIVAWERGQIKLYRVPRKSRRVLRFPQAILRGVCLMLAHN